MFKFHCVIHFTKVLYQLMLPTKYVCINHLILSLFKALEYTTRIFFELHILSCYLALTIIKVEISLEQREVVFLHITLQNLRKSEFFYCAPLKIQIFAKNKTYLCSRIISTLIDHKNEEILP